MLNFNNFRDFNYINQLCFKSLSKIPPDIDAIVCVPRSGYIFGTLLGEYLKRPVISLPDFLMGCHDLHLRKASLSPVMPENVQHVLLFDDAMGLGETMQNAKNKLVEHDNNLAITTCVLFVEPYSTSKVDVYFEVFENQFLPWNIMKRATNLGCFDMDGVLCDDVPKGIDDDGEKYINHIKTVKQKFVPDKRIKCIVTGRLEKYRSITEQWLKSHGIEYETLIMCPAKNHAERAKLNPPVYKAAVYSTNNTPIFIESNYKEAIIIHSLTKKPVYCTDICNMIT
jgi:uncharacterized HAD superfamily protein